MKIRITKPFAGKSRTYRATMTTDHPASQYGLPVMLLSDGEVLNVANWMMQGATIVEAPKRKDQVEMLARWIDNADAMTGGKPLDLGSLDLDGEEG